MPVRTAWNRRKSSQVRLSDSRKLLSTLLTASSYSKLLRLNLPTGKYQCVRLLYFLITMRHPQLPQSPPIYLGEIFIGLVFYILLLGTLFWYFLH